VLLILLIFAIPDVWAEIYIDNDHQYIGDDGVVHIVGEIINESNKPLNQVSVFATLYSGNNIVHETSSETLTNMIMPGMKGVFDIVIFENIGQTDHYALDLDYKVTQPKSQVIEITSSELTRGPLDNITIQGTVVNNGDATANMVKVTATLYDRHGNVIAVSQDRTEPDYLRASGESFFIVTIQDKLQADKIVDYSVVAESEEYTTVPEFPLGSGALLIASLSAYIVITKNPSITTSSFTRILNPKWIMARIR
jgi:hypothetical protein